MVCNGQKYKVKIDLPRFSPGRVKYRWGSGAWQEVQGSAYQIITPSLVSGAWPDDIPYGCSDFQYFTNFDSGAKMHYKGGSCRPYYPHLQYPLDGNSVFCVYSVSQNMQTCNNGYQFHARRVHFWLGGSKNCLDYSPLPLGQEGYFTSNDWAEGIQYRLKIYNGADLVYQGTQPEQPEAELIPPGWELPGNWVIWKSGTAQGEISYQANQDKSVTLYDGQTAIGTAYPPQGSTISPAVIITCLTKCPNVSCAIICEDVVCCYDQNGNLLGSFPLDEYDL